VQDEIAPWSKPAAPAALKVILEVSELETYDNIRAASFLAMRVIREGDFIKTSTGKTSLNATLGNNQVMLEAIRDSLPRYGRRHRHEAGRRHPHREAGAARSSSRSRKPSATPG
jgi:deoxyribose-phosphate aldolase